MEFLQPEQNGSCVASRRAGDVTAVLWNVSLFGNVNFTVHEDLVGRFSASEGSLTLHNLTHSDSGLYQFECRTEDGVTYEKNVSLTVCGVLSKKVSRGLEGTSEIRCEGADGGSAVEWIRYEFRYGSDVKARVLNNRTTLEVGSIRGSFLQLENTSVLHVSNISFYTLFICLVKNQQQCVSSHSDHLIKLPKVVYRSEGEPAVLHCTDSGLFPLWWKLENYSSTDREVGGNHSLVFPSLALNDSGWYGCGGQTIRERYLLVVCPKPGPPAVEVFSEGDDLAVRCTAQWASKGHYEWFVRSVRAGEMVYVREFEPSRARLLNGSLLLAAAAAQDAGEYVCAVLDSCQRCVSAARTVLIHREPFGVYSTFYAARWMLLGGLQVALCAAVVCVMQKSRRAEQLPAPEHV